MKRSPYPDLHIRVRGTNDRNLQEFEVFARDGKDLQSQCRGQGFVLVAIAINRRWEGFYEGCSYRAPKPSCRDRISRIHHHESELEFCRERIREIEGKEGEYLRVPNWEPYRSLEIPEFGEWWISHYRRTILAHEKNLDFELARLGRDDLMSAGFNDAARIRFGGGSERTGKPSPWNGITTDSWREAQ